jgi:Cu/Zn superoxide dismutase
MQLHLRSIAILSLVAAGILLVGTHTAGAATSTATINSISATGVGESLGTVTFMDTAQGMVITPELSGLPSAKTAFRSAC